MWRIIDWVNEDNKKPKKYDELIIFSFMVVVKSNGKFGFLSLDGNDLTSIRYEKYSIMHCYNLSKKSYSFFIKVKDNEWGLIDARGNNLIPCEYQDVQEFNESLAPVKKGNFWGFIDNKNEHVIDFQYDKISGFKNGFAIGQINGLWGIIDNIGKEKVPFIYDEIKYNEYGDIEVSLDGKFGVFDKNGEEIIKCEYDMLEYWPLRYFVGFINNKCGFYDGRGHEIARCEYDQVIPSFSKESIVVISNNKYGLIDFNERIRIECKYDFLFTDLINAEALSDEEFPIPHSTHEKILRLINVAIDDAIQSQDNNPNYETDLFPLAYVMLDNREGIVYRDGTEDWFDDV